MKIGGAVSSRGVTKTQHSFLIICLWHFVCPNAQVAVAVETHNATTARLWTFL